MPFDPDKDEVLDTALIEVEEQKSFIEAKLAAYNGGQPKVQLVRYLKLANGDKQFAKLGRLSLAEARALVPILQQWAFGE